MSPIDSTDYQPCSPSIARVKCRERTVSNNTNSFAILDRAADRVESSGFNRQRTLLILNQILFAELARLADRVQTSGCNRRTRLIILHR
eukprot:4419285-Pyramimonas_sp.AAC.1